VNIDGQTIKVKGPKGELTCDVHELISVEKENDVLKVISKKADAKNRLLNQSFIDALAGTTRANVNNMIIGVNEGCECKLVLFGVGYRAQVQGKQLNLTLGFSHPVNFQIPQGITIETPSQTEIVIKGVDKQLVGQVGANIRVIRPVEAYKGKGVRYSGERVSLKEVKKK